MAGHPRADTESTPSEISTEGGTKNQKPINNISLTAEEDPQKVSSSVETRSSGSSDDSMVVVNKLIKVVNEVTKKVKMSVVEDGKSTTSSKESSKDSSTKNDLKPKLLDLNALSTHMIKEVKKVRSKYASNSELDTKSMLDLAEKLGKLMKEKLKNVKHGIKRTPATKRAPVQAFEMGNIFQNSEPNSRPSTGSRATSGSLSRQESKGTSVSEQNMSSVKGTIQSSLSVENSFYRTRSCAEIASIEMDMIGARDRILHAALGFMLLPADYLDDIDRPSTSRQAPFESNPDEQPGPSWRANADEVNPRSFLPRSNDQSAIPSSVATSLIDSRAESDGTYQGQELETEMSNESFFVNLRRTSTSCEYIAVMNQLRLDRRKTLSPKTSIGMSKNNKKPDKSRSF